GGGVVDRGDGDREALRGAGVDAAVRRAAVVLEVDGDGGAAEGVGRRGEGERAGRGDGRPGAEEGGIRVAGDVEGDGLARLVGAGGEGGRPRLAGGAAVFEPGDVAAAREGRRVVDLGDRDRGGGAGAQAAAAGIGRALDDEREGGAGAVEVGGRGEA